MNVREHKLVNGHLARTWYDPACRSWVTQLCDAAGDQIGSATYVGLKQAAAANLQRLFCENGGVYTPAANAKKAAASAGSAKAR